MQRCEIASTHDTWGSYDHFRVKCTLADIPMRPHMPRSIRTIESVSISPMPPDSIVSAGFPLVMAVFET